MEASLHTISQNNTNNNKKKRLFMKMGHWVLLIITYICLFVGSVASSMLSRFYFTQGGSSKWVSTWVQSSGFPLLLIPIYFPYILNFRTMNPRETIVVPFSQFTSKLLLQYISIGIMLGFNNFLISWGVSYLPISTASLLLSTQLAFNLILSMILVKQKLSFSNLNAVILITLSSVLLALDSSHRPKNVSHSQYYLGFFAILGAGLLFALYLPLMEIVYKNVHSYQMMMEIQVIMQAAATVFATIGMTIDGGFTKMKHETNIFHSGSVSYQLVLGFNIVTWQMCFVGTAGIVFLTTSLTGGICSTALLPMNVLGGVLIFKDAFSGQKAVSTSLSLWGFCSYVYGEYKTSRQKEKTLTVLNNHQDDHDEHKEIGENP